MKRQPPRALAVASLLLVALLAVLSIGACASPARAPVQATYITREEIDLVNSTPGTDRNIRVVDIGHENFAVGVVHRAKTENGIEHDRPGTRSSQSKGSCGRPPDGAPTGGIAGGIVHDAQTEGYYILSGGGRMFTGGHLESGRLYDLAELNGPTCIGIAHGSTMHDVKAGDVVIIPAGVVHGWAEVPDHVDYLAFRPSPGVLSAGWIHPVILQRAED